MRSSVGGLWSPERADARLGQRTRESATTAPSRVAGRFDHSLVQEPRCPPRHFSESRVLRVQAECLFCHRVTQADARPSLVNIPGGGAVLECPACGSRQATSTARFVEFSRRSVGGPASPDAPQP